MQMATLDSTEALLEELRTASWDAAQADLAELRQFAKDAGETEELQQWDIGFWAERLRWDFVHICKICLIIAGIMQRHRQDGGAEAVGHRRPGGVAQLGAHFD